MLAEDKLDMTFSSSQSQASLFIGIGSPMQAIEFDDYYEKLTNFVTSIPKPTAIVAIGPNWLTDKIHITSANFPDIIYDFEKQENPVFKQLTYPCPGNHELSVSIQKLFQDRGHEAILDEERGIDSTIWLPLYVVFPDAEIPVIQISIPKSYDAYKLRDMGETLKTLRENGVLIIATGNIIYNNSNIDLDNKLKNPTQEAIIASDWMRDKLVSFSFADILDYEKKCPNTELIDKNKISPLFFIIGTFSKDDYFANIYDGFYWGDISLLTFGFVKNY